MNTLQVLRRRPLRHNAYTDTDIVTVVNEQSDRLEDFLLRKGFFGYDETARQFTSHALMLGKSMSIEAWTGRLRTLYHAHDRDHDRYTGNEPRITAHLGEHFGTLLEVAGMRPTSILDIGSGTGRIVSTIAHHFQIDPDYAIGLDLRLPHHIPENISFRRMRPDDVEASIGKRQFDVVVLSMVLRHSSQPDELLAQAVRVLRQGGILLIREHDAPGDIHQFLDVIHVLHEQVFPREGQLLPSLRTYQNLDSWQTLAESHGCEKELLEYRHYADHPTSPTNVFTMLLRKRG